MISGNETTAILYLPFFDWIVPLKIRPTLTHQNHFGRVNVAAVVA